MGWTLRWKKAKGSSVEQPAPELGNGCFRAEPATTLLATSRRRKLLEHIWQRTSLSRKQFDQLYTAPLHRFAELVQHLPASRNHHHAYPGGMLDHGLEIVAYALKIRQSYLLPLGTSPETQAAQTEAWTAAVAYAALLHDIGKIAVDVEVNLASGRRWHPWQGPIQGAYRVRFVEGREYKLHAAAAGLIYTQILSERIMDWLSEFPELWAALIFVLAGQYEHAGILGELVIQADRASVAQELGGDPIRAMSAPKQSLQRQLVEGLRHLVTDHLKLNQPEASDGWLTHDGLWLVSKTVADKLRAQLLAQGIEGIPSSNSTLFNVLQDHGIIQPNAEGKAIWKAAVDSANWQMTLTFLKISPALIWDATDRPTLFTGSVTPVSASGENLTSATSTEASAKEPMIQPSVAENTRAPIIAALKLEHEPGYAESTSLANDDIDSLLTLLGMSESPIEVIDNTIISANSVSKCNIPDDTSDYAVGRIPTDLGALHISDDPTKLGGNFIQWLRSGVLDHRIIINDSKAKVHSVADTAFIVTPELFQRYAQEHPEVMKIAKSKDMSDWRLVQREFERLNLHRKRDDGLNIWTCEVKGPRKTKNVKGYLLKDPMIIFSERPYNNPYLLLIEPTSIKG